jgi:hypothetical protein
MGLPPPWWPDMPPVLVHAGVLLGVVLILIGASLVLNSTWAAARQGRRMLPLIGMAIFGLGFLGCGAWYFWPRTQEERILTNGPVVLSNFRAQINNDKKLVIAFHYENTGSSVARSIKIETKAGVGPVPIQGEPAPPPFMITTSYNYVDDLAPRGNGDITLVVDHVLSHAEWAAINGKPFGCAAWGAFNYRQDGDRVSEPFDYVILRPPGQDLSKMTNMMPRPEFLPRPN